MKKSFRGILEDKSMVWQIMVFLLLMLLFSMLAIGLWWLTGGSQTTASLKLMQTLQTIGTFMLPALVAAWLWSKQPLTWLRLNKSISWQTALLVVLLLVVAAPFINLLAWLNSMMVLPDFLSGLEQLMQQQEEELY